MNYQTIPECGWPVKISDEDPNDIDLNDGSSVCLEDNGETYTWYDINGSVIESFPKDSTDFDVWLRFIPS